MPQSVDGDIRLSASFKLDTSDVKQQAKQLKQSLDDILSSKDTRGNPKLEKLATQLQKSYFSVEKLQKKLRDAQNERILTPEMASLKSEYKKIETEIENIIKKQDKMKALGTDTDQYGNITTGWEKLNAELDLAKKKEAEIVQKTRELLDAGKAFTLGDPAKISAITQQLSFATQNGEQLKNKFEEVKAKAENIAESPSKLGKAFEVAKVAASAFGRIAKTAFEGGKKAARVFGNVVKAAVGVAKRAISGLKFALDRVKTGFSSLKDKAKQAFEHADKSASKGLKNLLRYGLGIRGLFMLFRKLRGYASDAFKGIAQQSASFNKTMSNITNTFNQFKGSIGTALQPLITIVEPVLIRIMNLFINAANAVGSFFATLTGQKYIYKAVKANNSYADSVSGTGKAAKEARKELAAYDKLIVISSQDAEDAAGGGSGGGGGFTEELIDPTNSVSKFAQDLKDAWESQDFAAIGEIVGNKINEIVSKIDEAIKWDNVGPKITEWVNNIGTAFNSLIDTIDWALIGQTIGDGLNTITYTIETFLDSFNIDEVGTKLAELANSLNNTVDWEAVGRTTAKGLNEITGAINNFADDTNWESIGSNFASSINSLLDNVDGEALGKALSAKLKIGLELADGFVKEFHWSDLGSTLSDVVDGWFGNIDWETLGNTIATGLNGIADTITTFADETDWQDKGDKIGSALSSLVDGIDADKIGGALAAPFNMLIKSVDGFLKNFEKNGTWSDAGEKIGKAISSWFQTIDWKTAASNLTKGADGIVDFIKTAFENIKWSEIGTKLGTLINGVFKIDWKDVGKTISKGASGVLDFFTSALDTIEWADLGQAIIDFITGIEWGELFKKAIKLLAKLGEGIGLILKGAWNTAIDALIASDNIPDWLKKMLGKVKFKEEDLKMKSDELAGDVEKTLSDSVQKHGGNGGKFDVPVDVKYDSTKTENYEKDTKEFNGLNSKSVKAELLAEKGRDFDTNKAAYKDLDSKQAKAELLAEKGRDFDTNKAAYKDLDSKQAKAELLAEKGRDFDTNRSAYKELDNKQAKAQLLAEKSGDFETNKKAYDSLTSRQAKAELLAEKGKNFDTTKKAYDNVKDKKVSVTAGLGDSVQKTASGWWSKIVSYYKSSDKYKAAGGKLPVGATAPADKSKVATWWNSIKSWWGSHTLGMKGSVTDVSLTDKAKGQLKTSLQLYLPQKPNAKQPQYQAAKGGVFRTPTHVYLGENGPEAVVPLKNNTQWLDIVSKYVTAHMNLGKLDIPHLAQGSVIPPNRQFLAMLGDQRHGTNVEAPLKTIEQALENVINRLGRSGSNAPIILQLDGKQIAKVVWSESDKRYKQTGKAFA